MSTIEWNEYFGSAVGPPRDAPDPVPEGCRLVMAHVSDDWAEGIEYWAIVPSTMTEEEVIANFVANGYTVIDDDTDRNVYPNEVSVCEMLFDCKHGRGVPLPR
jgi:hypothetical protein